MRSIHSFAGLNTQTTKENKRDENEFFFFDEILIFLCKIIWSEIYLRFINIYSRMTRHLMIWVCWWSDEHTKCRQKRNHDWEMEEKNTAPFFSVHIAVWCFCQRKFSIKKGKVTTRKTWTQRGEKKSWMAEQNIDVLFSAYSIFKGFFSQQRTWYYYIHDSIFIHILY